MKRRSLLSILCACFTAFGLAGGLATSFNVDANRAFAEDPNNVAFINKVKKFSTYSADVMDTYLTPIWNTDEVVDESATIVTKTGSTSLLYIPIEGSVVIRDYHNKNYYVEGTDFSVDYKTGVITRLIDGELPYFELTEYVGTEAPVGGGLAGLDKNEIIAQNDVDVLGAGNDYRLLYYKDKLYMEHHFNVSYRVNTSLTGQEEGVRTDKVKWESGFVGNDRVTNQTEPEVVSSQAPLYSDFLKKLKLENEATIMFYGDSITYGCDATGFINGGGNYNPYLPRFSDLVAQWLSREYGANVTALNGAVGGWTTIEGTNFWQEAHPLSEMGQHGMAPADYAGETDLLVLAFGMNDAIGDHLNRNQFIDNLSAIINAYYQARGDKGGAVMLVSNMMPNTHSTWYDGGVKFHNEVEEALEYLAGVHVSRGRSVAVAPVGGVFKTFEEKGKRTRNWLANNINHPTDFGVRVYAQTILQTLTGYADEYVQDGKTYIGNNDIMIGQGASIRMNTMSLGTGNSFMSGIRFRGYVNDKYFDSIRGENGIVLKSRYQAGMWIIPEQILDRIGLELNSYTDEDVQRYIFESNPENAGKEFVYNPKNPMVSDIKAVIWDDRQDDKQIDGYVRFNAAMLKLPESYFGTNLVARAYILDKETGTYYVSRGWQCRNIAEVASQELLTNANLSPDQIELLEWFVEKGVGTTQLPATFFYNGVRKPLANPTSTYQCDSCETANMTATDLIDGKYCPDCSPTADIDNPVNWCSAHNQANCGDTNHGKWNIVSYYHSTCARYYTKAQLLDGKYCPTCAVPAKEMESTGGKAVVALTRGDTFQLTKTSNDIMPMVMVKDAEEQWVQLNEVYGDFFSYDSKTGKVTVINVPDQTTLEIPALVTLQSKTALNGETGILSEKTQEWTIELFNASIDTHRKNYVFSHHAANATYSGKVPLDIPTFVYDVNSDYVKLEYSCSNADVEVDGNTLWVKGKNGTMNGGVYEVKVAVVAVNPIEHTLKTETIKVTVEASYRYDYMILDTSSDQYGDKIANLGSEDNGYIWYDEAEQAYRYKTNTPSTQKVSLLAGNRFTEKCNAGAWKYPYFMIDVKFNNANGEVVDGQRYDNTLAFGLFTGNTLWFTGNGTRDQVRIFLANDSYATPLSYSEIASNCWYTIAIPMSKYGLTERLSAFTLFYGASEDGSESATDMYFANLRFADYVGSTLESDGLDVAKSVTVSGEEAMEVTWLPNYDGGAWRYSVGKNYGVKIEVVNGERTYTNNEYGVSLTGSDLDSYNTLASQYNYVAIDVKYDAKDLSKPAPATAPLVVFGYKNETVGFGYNSEEYLIKANRSGYIHRVSLAGDLEHPTSKAQVGVWQTVLIKNPSTLSKYLLGILNVDGNPIPDNLAVYFRNLRFINDFQEELMGLASSSDFVRDNKSVVVSNLHVARNTEIEQQQYYTSVYGSRPTYEQQVGYGDNPDVPTSLSPIDATFATNSEPTHNKGTDPNNNTNYAWFGANGTNVGHSVPQSMTNHMTAGSYDNTITQYTFTNWGYTYSDKVVFNTPIDANELQSISFRIYTVLSPYTVYNKNFFSAANAYRWMVPYCGSCGKFYSIDSYNSNTACSCGGKIKRDYKDIKGNYFVVDPVNQANTAWTYAYDANAWNACQTGGFLSGILNANGDLVSGVKKYNEYDTAFGGVRFFPLDCRSVSNASGFNGLMIPANVAQSVWTTVTFSGADVKKLADEDGLIRGFWVGQSAGSSITVGHDNFQTFIDKGFRTPDCAYMNLDTISAVRKTDSYRVQMAPASHLGTAPIADITIDGKDTVTGRTKSKAPKPVVWSANEGSNVLQYEFMYKVYDPATGAYNLTDQWVAYKRVWLKNPVHKDSVNSITMRTYVSGFNKATPSTGGIFIHGVNPSYLTTNVDGKHPNVLTNGYGYQVPQSTTFSGYQYITVPADAIADADGMIRGIIVAIDWNALADTTTVMTPDPNKPNEKFMGYAYINLDWIDFAWKDTVTTTEYNAIKGYRFDTINGWNETMPYASRERLSMGGTLLSHTRTYLTSHNYIKLDVNFDAHMKNNLLFAQGYSKVAETYYALKGGFTIGGIPVEQAMIYLQSEANNPNKRVVAYEDMVEGTWYTIVIPVKYPTTVKPGSEYCFDIMTYASSGASAQCKAWINNLSSSSNEDLILIGDDGADFDMFSRFVSDNETVVKYQDFGGDIGKAYKLNANGYIGFSEEAKQRIGKTTRYTSLTIDFRLEDYIEDMNNPWDENRKWLYNALFFNQTNTYIGLGDSYENGKLIVDNVARVYDADGNRVDLLGIKADTWYTVEILNPVIDWAFLGSVDTEIYFRNVVWHAGKSDDNAYANGGDTEDGKSDNDVWVEGDYELWD